MAREDNLLKIHLSKTKERLRCWRQNKIIFELFSENSEGLNCMKKHPNQTDNFHEKVESYPQVSTKFFKA